MVPGSRFTLSLTVCTEGLLKYLVMFCLYGSATGKAQSIAEQIVQQGSSKGIEVKKTPDNVISFAHL